MASITKALAGTAIGVAAMGAWSRFVVDHDHELDLPVPVDESSTIAGPHGDIAVYAAGTDLDAEPVVFVHSVNAAASAYELRPLFEAYAIRRPTYAFDLPGYGHSSRGPVGHSAVTMTEAVVAVLRMTGPAHVIGLSLGGEFAARAAVDHPDLVRSLTLISPTGLSSPGRTPNAPWVERMFGLPVLGRAVFDLLATKVSIRWFLAKSFTGGPDPGLVEYAYATAHQAGAEHAPAAFLSGVLFTPDALTDLYLRVTCPTLVLYDEDPYTDFARLPDLVEHGAKVSAVRIAGTRGLPHFEQPDAVIEALDRHMDGSAAR
ncbi:MAG: alpha/beta hydrolase [Acidimicrobiia bacterium]|nr:alpha/beta hydrolase [Acidimicrobiia bacterium]